VCEREKKERGVSVCERVEKEREKEIKWQAKFFQRIGTKRKSN